MVGAARQQKTTTQCSHYVARKNPPLEVIKNIETIYERKIGQKVGTFVICQYKSSFIFLLGFSRIMRRLK